jgi:hypothetical protein
MRFKSEKTGRFAPDADLLESRIRQSRSGASKLRQKRLETDSTPGVARFLNHTQMFDVSQKGTGL